MTQETDSNNKKPLILALILIAVIAIISFLFFMTNNKSSEKSSSQKSQSTTSLPTPRNPSDSQTDIKTMCSDHMDATVAQEPFDTIQHCTDFLESLIGLSEQAATQKAEQANAVIRVVHRDGEDLIATMDFIDNRVNISVNQGKVIAVTLG